jgi:cyclopropane-fatty-acyl-phospholipid synthase
MTTLHEASTAGTGRVTALERAALRHVLAVLEQPPLEVVLWNGEVVRAGYGTAIARVIIRRRGWLWPLLYRPDLYFGAAYSRGAVDIEGDIVRLLEYFEPLERNAARRRWWERLKLHLPLRESRALARARSNIHHHYDIGNTFYRLWLDPELVYTCAYFPERTTGLADAQQAKMEYVCRKLCLQPGETVVEAGCGWGGLSLYMARHCGVRVRAYNISREQVLYARARARAEGLDGQVEFIEQDYRSITDTCDAFVSVGMLEHVGKVHYGEFGAVIDRCLGPGGRGLLHSIGRDRPMLLNAWIEHQIFPGAYPPALGEMLEVLAAGGFSVLDIENLRLHYARTVELWLQRYERSADEVRRMFDEEFVRAWRFYLAGSIAAFRSGSLQLFQLTFSRPGARDLPWTRAGLYQDRLPESPA